MPYPKVSLLNKRFGYLKVVDFLERNSHGNSIWACICDCGAMTEAYYQHLVMGDKRSCGKCGLVKKGLRSNAKLRNDSRKRRHERKMEVQASNKRHAGSGAAVRCSAVVRRPRGRIPANTKAWLAVNEPHCGWQIAVCKCGGWYHRMDHLAPYHTEMNWCPKCKYKQDWNGPDA